MVRKIQTEIIINASAQQIWDILMDFDNHTTWNPFIRSISGTPEKGNSIKVELKSSEDKTMEFNPKIVEFMDTRLFTWQGKLILPKIFDGRHSFELEEINDNTTRFKHYEEFSGILVWPILKFIGDDTRNNFIAMNQALKELVENTN